MSTTEQGASYYDLLGVDENATTDEIKKAYRKVARRLHPDVAGAGMEGLFNQVTRAHDVLTDPARRAEYDAQRFPAAPEPEPDPEPEPWGTEEVVIEDLEPEPTPQPTPPPAPQPPPPPGPAAEPMPVRGALNDTAALKLRFARVAAPAATAATFVFGVISGPLTRLLTPAHMFIYSASALPMIIALTPLALMRIFRQRGKVSLLILLAITGLQAAQAEWPQFAGGVLLMVTAELWRVRRRQRGKIKAATMWQQFQTQAAGRDLWVMSIAPQGNRTLALLQNPYTLEREQKMIWGTVAPGTWIVLGEARDVLLTCPEEARIAWEELYG